MKSFLYTTLLYLFLAVLLTRCTEVAPEPVCISAEVVGPDCDSGWYILKLAESTEASGKLSNGYTGQLQGGYVTTNNLPEELRQPGTAVGLALEIYGESAPRCVSVAVMYPAVQVKRVCGSTVTHL
ncbi:hypothetical protein ACSX1A_19335 [Pontibacter sp. MBLB2868]|uniref:hypothetical protein n=1 Tax=Pontibacter sp. MBLB2868 TaxID=3451555 RepID=UPI003F7547E8